MAKGSETDIHAGGGGGEAAEASWHLPLIAGSARSGALHDGRYHRQRTESDGENENELILRTALDGVWMLDMSGWLLKVNPAAAEMLGYTREEMRKLNVTDIDGTGSPEDTLHTIQQLRETGSRRFETRLRHRDGRAVDVEASFSFLPAGNERCVAFIRDISERKRSEAERERLWGQLLQAQRMESIGRLAGGVAHDFNNMLGVIIGHAEMALAELQGSHPICEDLREIEKAAARSADLTRQLLAFARKQTIAPKVLDLNETVTGMLKMIRRLIGENIDLVWRPGARIWPVRIDPGQVDQILANLCVNARDAINGTGEVTIQTANTLLDETFCAENPGSVPGEYLLLSLSDNGCGIDAETIEHIFEPFYTTKGAGEGTGLGLATVYGIVKQNDGYIAVHSEPGRGTCFMVYLPRHAGSTEEHKRESPELPMARGETVLLVEDEQAMLSLAKKMLGRLGYRVLAARTPGGAMAAAIASTGSIDLLITDVIMPEMNGRDLAARLHALQPGCRLLYTSGYTADVIAEHGVLDEGVQYLQKPFTMQLLANKVRAVLDAAEP